MKKFAALLLAASFALGTFAAAEGDFSPATAESPSAEVSAAPSAEVSAEPSAEPSGGFPRVVAPGDYVVRVGLYYGSSSLVSANLANEVGSGYLFGWYDEEEAFHAVGSTAEEKITMLSDRTLYLSGGVYSTSASSGAAAVGAYHVQSGYPCSSFEQAVETANAVKAGGNPAFPAYIGGEWRVRIGSYASASDAESARAALALPESTVVGGSESCYTVAATNSGEILFEFDDGGDRFGVLPVGDENPITWHKGYKWYGGFEYRRQSSGAVSVINLVEIGDYTKGVVPYEIGTNWTEDGTKVGALCAASFALFNENRHKSYGFDVCNTDHCQVYQGQNRATDFTNACCEAVAGEAVFYNGEVCNAVYHSSNGGYTESAKNVWGYDYPYLQAVEDTYEDLDSALHGRWSFSYTGEEIAWILNQKGYPIGTVTKAWVEEFTDAGNVYRVSFQDAAGTKQSFTMERARSILGSDTLGKYTYSQRYTITSGGDLTLSAGAGGDEISASGAYAVGADGRAAALSNPSEVYVLTASGTDRLSAGGEEGVFLVSGTGWGHNVGLSQWGSRGRAQAGWSYREIVEYYYTGAKVQKISEVLG